MSPENSPQFALARFRRSVLFTNLLSSTLTLLAGVGLGIVHQRFWLTVVLAMLAISGSVALLTQQWRSFTHAARSEAEAWRKQETSGQQLAELELIYQTAPVGLAQLDRELRVVRINKQMAAINGVPLEKQRGRLLSDVLPAALMEKLAPRYHQIFQTGEPLLNLEVTGQTAAQPGVVRDWLVSHFPLHDAAGNVIGINSVVQEITERKRAEAALRESEESFRTLANNISQFAWMADATGSIFWYNQRWFDYTGTTPAEMQGWGWQQVHHPDHIARVVTRLRRSITTGEPWEDTFPLRGADGQYRWFLSRALPIHDEAGRVVRWFGTNTDITEHLAAEREREALLKREREARETAEAATRAKDDFLALVTHELRNPLQSILGYTRLTQQQPHDPDAVLHNCEIIARSARAQQQLIEDLLDTARIVTGKLKLETTLTDLRLVLADAVNIVRPAAEAKQISLAAELGYEPQEVLGDAARLQQVTWNLLQNAIKFTPAGGHIRLQLENQGEQIRFTVSDTGSGIEPEFLPHIFDRFRQSHRTQQQGGLGVGLALARQLVELHGGTITAASQGANTGATFTVTLPLAPPQLPPLRFPVRAVSETTPTEVSFTPPSLADVRVLVIDDEPAARELVAMSLRHGGAKVQTAASGAAAMQWLTEQPAEARPQILVCDISMPDEDGYAVLQRLRVWEASQELPPLPAIALTAHGRAEDRLQALRAGFQMHLVKPVEPLELALTIASLLDRRL
ncbi:MAG: PAS domain-containing protein [Blastocatellia bacterium]